MSWFDTSGIANLAKNALKEAQKTIDKALDIKDDEQTPGIAPKGEHSSSTHDASPPEDEVDGFFNSWGLKSSGSISGENKNVTVSPPSTNDSESAAPSTTATSNSIWGSFTGSFFDAAGKPEPDKNSTDGPVFRQPQKSLLNLTTSQESGDSSSQGWVSTEEGAALSDEESPEKFRQSKLVVQPEPDSPLEVPSSVQQSVEPARPPASLSLSQRHLARPAEPPPHQEVIPLRKAVSSAANNRLSVISSSTGSPDESGSVEVLGSNSEDSTSPETGLNAKGIRTSFLSESSPESVGVLGGSGDSSNFTSPSSVEVLGWSEANSPLSPAGPAAPHSVSQGLLRRYHPGYPSALTPLGISPEGAEGLGGVQEEESEEVSLADDSSASSATVATVLEPQPLSVAPPLQEAVVTPNSQVRNLLAEAMEEQDVQAAPREHSPISSESRSETARQGSGHTSGDELETTTTSSDIEIISSPNGDGGSSTHSARHSPAKLPMHSNSLLHGARVLAPLADGGSSMSPEALLMKLSEMSSVLEAREMRLVELSRTNVELQQNNDELNRQLEAGLRSQATAQDIRHVTEEYTQRLSALERKFQQAIRDRDACKKQLEEAQQEVAAHASCAQLQGLLVEREEEARELRVEGEKLSKQQLQLSTLVKKLRAREKEMEGQAKTQKQQISDLTQETERLKRSLGAKEGVERSQIEAVDRLTAQIKRQERELSTMNSEVAEAVAAKDRLQAALDSANKEIGVLRSSQLSAELAQQAELGARLAEAQAQAAAERVAHEAALEQLRGELATAAEASSRREETLRREQAALLRRLTETEARADELAHAASEATRPLLRQLEALQSGSMAQQVASDRAERSLADRLADAQARLATATELERQSRDKRATLSSQVTALQSEVATLSGSLRELHVSSDKAIAERDKAQRELATERSSHSDTLAELKREMSTLRDQLAVQQAAAESEKRHRIALQAELQRQPIAQPALPMDASLTVSLPSPTLSFGPLPSTPPRSLSSPGSLIESLQLHRSWPHEELHEALVAEVGGSSSGPSALHLEALQSQLKRRDGELSLLRAEARKLELHRSELTRQVASLSARADSQAAELSRLKELEHKYDALLQMYGEQLEANQELRLDLDDVKEMYRTQIEALLQAQQQPPSPTP